MDRLAVRYWFTFGHFVINPFPFPLDLNTTLRGWLVKARIHFWTRVATNLAQYDHSHGSFLVGRRVGHGVGLGSYIVNAQAGCSDCHTCPSYKPGHNPFHPPFGVSGDGQFNDVGYLAGGVDFGPPLSTVTSHNITPDPSTGKPDGLTLRQFYVVMRTGHDPVRNDNLAVMPWPYFRYVTDRDLDAIYAFLSAIPSATPPATHCRLF